MKKINLLKWKEPEGGTVRLHLIQDMSPKWKKIGSLIGLTKAQLEGWETQHLKVQEDCMNSVIGAWMDRSNDEIHAVSIAICKTSK